MKEKIKKIIPSIFISMVIGVLFGKILFKIYDVKNKEILESKMIYLLIDDTYKDYDSMKANTINSSYIYYEDKEGFNKVVAITKNKDNIKKIEDTYNKSLKVSKYLLNDKEINKKLEEYDKKLIEANSPSDIQKNVIDFLNIYKERENIKLIKIS